MFVNGDPVHFQLRGDPVLASRWKSWAVGKAEAYLQLLAPGGRLCQTLRPVPDVEVRLDMLDREPMRITIVAGKRIKLGFFFVPASSQSSWGWGYPYKNAEGNDINGKWGAPSVHNPAFTQFAHFDKTQHFLTSGRAATARTAASLKLRRPVQNQTLALGGQIAAQVPTGYAHTVSVQGYPTGWLPQSMHGENGYNWIGSDFPQLGWYLSYSWNFQSPIFVDGKALVLSQGAGSQPVDFTQCVGVGVNLYTNAQGEQKERLIGIAMLTNSQGTFVGNYRCFYTSDDWGQYHSCGDFYVENTIGGLHYPVTFFFKQDCTRASAIRHARTYRAPTASSGYDFGALFDFYYRTSIEPESVHVDFGIGASAVSIAPTGAVYEGNATGIPWTVSSENFRDFKPVGLVNNAQTGNNAISVGGASQEYGDTLTANKTVERIGPKSYTIAIGYIGNQEKRCLLSYDRLVTHEQWDNSYAAPDNKPSLVPNAIGRDYGTAISSYEHLRYAIGNATAQYDFEPYDIENEVFRTYRGDATQEVRRPWQRLRWLNLIAVDLKNDAVYCDELVIERALTYEAPAFQKMTIVSTETGRRRFYRNSDILREEAV